jgi:TrpR family transcriptional regulator, trp operon repressor
MTTDGDTGSEAMTRRRQKAGGTDIRAVVELFASVHGRRDMRRLLEEMLTPAEVHDLALRWRLVQCLHAGEPQRRIASELGISLCKITRGSRILKRPGGVVRRLLDRPAPRRRKNGRTEERKDGRA